MKLPANVAGIPSRNEAAGWTAAIQAVIDEIESIVRARFPEALISWKLGPHGRELKVGGVRYPRVGRLFVLDLTADVTSICHKWPGLGEFHFNSLSGWTDHAASNQL